MNVIRVTVVLMLAAGFLIAQVTNDPFPTPITATEGVIAVKFVEFATIPDIAGTPTAPPAAARMMTMVNEPATRRLFVSDMTGPMYIVSYDGKTVTPYLDINAPNWEVGVQSRGSERGVQSFAFHPQFGQRGSRGFGKFYVITDTTNTNVTADFKPAGGNHTHDTVLLEWTARNPNATTYDGAQPRELMRFESRSRITTPVT